MTRVTKPPFVLAAIFLCAWPAQQEKKPPAPPYAILVSKDTCADAAWKRAVDALEKKHRARVFTFDYPDVWAVQDAVAAYAPRYLCVVARPTEAIRGFMKEVILFVRTLDDDPYEDAIWAVLTGFDAGDALRIVNAEPLEIARGISHVGTGWLDWMEEGVSWSETTKNQKTVKEKGQPSRNVAGPDETSHEMAGELNKGQFQIVSTSGHATEYDWEPGYDYPDGRFISRKGRLFALDLRRKEMEIKTPCPKIYMSCGNCLIANARDMDSMVLAWIHSGGVNQFFGHIVPQYRTCWAWDVADYFFSLQGRHTFAESFMLFHHDVNARLLDGPGDEQRLFLTSDQESTVLYGDPAWEARIKRVTDPQYEQTLVLSELGAGEVQIVFTVKAVKECAPSAPPGALLPFRIKDATVTRLDGAKAVVADDFVLLRLLKDGEKTLPAGQSRSVTIKAKRTDKLKRTAARIDRQVERLAATAASDLPAASAESRPIVDVKKAPAQGDAPTAETGGWKIDGGAAVHVPSGARVALPGRQIKCCAWDGKYLWLAEKGMLHVIARQEILFSIPLPEMEDPVAMSMAADEGRVRGAKDEVSFRVDRSILTTLGPKKRALLDLWAAMWDQGNSGMDVAKLTLPLPWDTNRQKIVGEIALSGPARVVADRWGQKAATFTGLTFEPRVEFRPAVAWTAEMQESRTWVWPDRVGPLSAIPKAIAEKYLADGGVLRLAAPDVKRAAAEAVGGEREPYWMARSIYRYVIGKLTYQRGAGWSPVPELLQKKVGTCSEFTFLLIALCRANGLPARFAAGTRCREGNPGVDYEFHRWAEVYLPGYGWVPVDASAVDSKDPVSRGSNFGHVAETDFVTVVGGGDSEIFGWDCAAMPSVNVTSYPQHEADVKMSRGVTWGVPGAAIKSGRDPLFNADFDTGTLEGWIEEGPHLSRAFGGETRTGKGAALQIRVNPGASCDMDIPGHPELWQKVYRKVRVPKNAAFLHFWAKVQGLDYHEPVSVFVDTGAGPKGIFSQGGGGGTAARMDWTELFVDIAPYQGMAVMIGFYGANPNGYGDHLTDIFVDDVFLCDKDRKRIDVSPPAKAVDPALKAQIDGHVARLADPSVRERGKAIEALAKIGQASRAALEAAAGSEKAAQRLGAKAALEALDAREARLTDEDRAENAMVGKGR